LVKVVRLTPEVRKDPQAFDAWVQPLVDGLKELSGPAVDYQVRRYDSPEGEPEGLELIRLVHGIPETRLVPFDFFDSADYARIASLGEKLQGLVQPGAQVSRGERSAGIEDFAGAYDWLINEGKRGYHIQRYKGLGEMNPEQLWDTTMDPASRRLLRVTIEDAVAADQIFTTLMGEQVEPRRAFIERNALEAENIDV
jgi:DNA gyrase subunit B